MIRVLILAAALAGSAVSAAGAQAVSASPSTRGAVEFASVDRGLMVAGRLCAECHAIRRGETQSPNAEAPNFQTVARTRGMTRTALIAFFRSPHQRMPNLVLEGDDADDIIDYILSLAR